LAFDLLYSFSFLKQDSCKFFYSLFLLFYFWLKPKIKQKAGGIVLFLQSCFIVVVGFVSTVVFLFYFWPKAKMLFMGFVLLFYFWPMAPEVPKKIKQKP
jgi:hypothetical protein